MRLTELFKKCTMAAVIMALIIPQWGCGNEKITPVSGNIAQQESTLSKETKESGGSDQSEKPATDAETKPEDVTKEPQPEELTKEPTEAPTEATAEPVQEPTEAPTEEPTQAPTEAPAAAAEPPAPTQAPTEAPTEKQTEPPAPTQAPTEAPAEKQTEPPAPTHEPTQAGAGKLTAPFNIAFLGDSITLGHNSSYSYADVVCEDLKAVKRNYGLSGDTLASDGGHGFIERYTSISKDNDVIVVYGGSNDYYRNVPLGSPDSGKKDEFYGALKALCEGLKDKYPQAHIVFITPLRGEFFGKNNCGNNETGSSMWDYVDAMKKVCAQYGIHVIDIYNNFIIDGENFDEYTTDGLHPNEKGHDVIAAKLEKYIKSLM